MPPKVTGRGIQSNLIVTETGKRLYGSDRPYQEQMQKLTGKYVQDVTLVKQSEFKKPYLENSYPEMEYFQYPGFPEPKFPSGPGGFNKDCNVGYEVAGAVEGWRICAPSDDCAGWVFTCAHKIVSFTCGNCQIAKLMRITGDKILVVICSKSDTLDVKYLTNDGKTNFFRQKRNCVGTGSECGNCVDCKNYPPVIGYTTQQMFLNGTQNLNADGGGGGPYTWSIISGGGTLSKTVTTNNEMNLYTAPSENPDCFNNPTIQVKDYCGNVKTLKIAVNSVTGDNDAYHVVEMDGSLNCHYPPGIDNPYVFQRSYRCDGNVHGTGSYCARCSSTCPGCGGSCSVVPCGTCGDCSQSTISANCDPTNCPDGCVIGTTTDYRTQFLLDSGCCPVALL